MAREAGPQTRLEAALLPARSTIQHLWSSLVRRGEDQDSKRVLFTSTQDSEGTSTIAACAAIGLARNLLCEVILLEANFLRPCLAETLGIAREPGLTELLRGEAILDEVLRSSGVPGLRLIVAGSPHATGYMGSERLRQALAKISAHCHHLVIDAPPLLTCPESRLLLPFVDEVVLVTQAGETSKTDIKKAMRVIDSSGASFLGAVLNQYKRVAPAWLVPEE